MNKKQADIPPFYCSITVFIYRFYWNNKGKGKGKLVKMLNYPI